MEPNLGIIVFKMEIGNYPAIPSSVDAKRMNSPNY
jgi:hypothetical protein